MFNLIFILFTSLLLQPIHEYHTSLMTMSYDKDLKAFEVEIEVDTEHFEEVINGVYETDIHLGEKNEVEDVDDLIEAYLNESIFLKINKKIIGLTVSAVEVDYAVTIIKLEPIGHRRKVKRIEIEGNYMLEKFPKQKNLVNIFYKDKKKSLLFDSQNSSESIRF